MAPSDRPNVVVFFTDQQRWDTVGAYGNPMDITPTLDAAAAEGTLVENAVTPQPVCTPARACLQTGQYATTNGVYENQDKLASQEYGLARVFDRAGYETGYVGKVHVANTRTDPVPEGDRMGYRDYWRAADALEYTSHPYEGLVYDGAGDPVEFDGYRVDALTEMGIEFIERDRDDPFLLTISHVEPHHQNDMGSFVAPDGYAYRHRGPWIPPDLRSTPGDWYEELPDYYGMCERLDECYGRVLDALEREGVLDDTVVVFLSDHGCHFDTREGGYKRTCHESSVRVPMVFRGPGFENGGRIEEPVSLVDVAPTLIDAAGITVPPEMEGNSIRPLVERPDPDWKDSAFVQTISWAEVGRAIRTDRWKYSVFTPDAPREPYGEEPSDPQPDRYQERYLYDLDTDPYEQVNLVGRGDYRDVADRLRTRLLDRIEAVEGTRVDIERASYRA